jgi:thiol-disulfide isomerase/thioredoxin
MRFYLLQRNNASKICKNVATFVIVALLNCVSYAETQIIGNTHSTSKTAESKLLSLRSEISKFNPIFEPRTIFKNLKEQELTFREFRGKFIILYFYASWCAQCKDELKSLNALVEELKYRNINEIEVIPLSVDFKETKELVDFFSINKINNLNIYMDSAKQSMSAFGVKSLPTTFFINKSGNIIIGFEDSLDWNSPETIKLIFELAEVTSGNKINDNQRDQPIISGDKDKPMIIR